MRYYGLPNPVLHTSQPEYNNACVSTGVNYIITSKSYDV